MGNKIILKINKKPNIPMDILKKENINFDFKTNYCNTNYEPLTNKPQINGITLIGNKTSEELGIESDKNYFHSQTTASDEWVIIHNLNKYPAVSIIDSANEEVVGEVIYNNTNQITIKFKGAFKGKATLN